MKFSIEDLKKLVDKEKLGDWVLKYKRQVAVGCILVCVGIVAVAAFAGKGEGETTDSKTNISGAVATAAEGGEAVPVEETNELEQDAYAEVNALVQKYYEYMSAGDMEGLASVVDEISEEEKNRILRSKDLVEGYQNISCYTKKGLEEDSYLVFVYYELKFVQIDTPAPGLEPQYVYTNDEGKLVIFNGEPSEELAAYAEEMGQEEDVLKLRQEVKAKYEEAKASDEELAKREERYVRVASEEEIPEEPVEEAGEETAEETTEGEETEETVEEASEEPEASEEEEEPTQSQEVVAQNRETRFTEAVRLRAEPSTEAESLGTVYQGENVTQIESYADGWSKINYKGKECYCKTEFLE